MRDQEARDKLNYPKQMSNKQVHEQEYTVQSIQVAPLSVVFGWSFLSLFTLCLVGPLVSKTSQLYGLDRTEKASPHRTKTYNRDVLK